MTITWSKTYPGGINPDDPATAVTDTWGDNVDTGIQQLYQLPNAKGDLIVATAADTLERQAVGADDSVLTAASGQTPGVIWQKIGNAMVATNAAIAYSKLNLAGSIVDADIASAAAIALSKLAATAWTTYTPVLTGAGGNPTMGTGSAVVGRWMKIGRLVIAIAHLTFGTTPANPTGLWIVSLPEAAQATNRFVCVGTLYDNSPVKNYMFMGRTNTTSDVHLFYNDGDRFTGTIPITVAVNDFIALIAVYESAS